MNTHACPLKPGDRVRHRDKWMATVAKVRGKTFWLRDYSDATDSDATDCDNLDGAAPWMWDPEVWTILTPACPLKPGDRVKCCRGWTATVAKVRGQDFWLRDYAGDVPSSWKDDDLTESPDWEWDDEDWTILTPAAPLKPGDRVKHFDGWSATVAKVSGNEFWLRDYQRDHSHSSHWHDDALDADAPWKWAPPPGPSSPPPHP